MKHAFDPYEVIADLREYAHELFRENQRLKLQLEACHHTQEDIALGTKMFCHTCGGYKPCTCDK